MLVRAAAGLRRLPVHGQAQQAFGLRPSG